LPGDLLLVRMKCFLGHAIGSPRGPWSLPLKQDVDSLADRAVPVCFKPVTSKSLTKLLSQALTFLVGFRGDAVTQGQACAGQGALGILDVIVGVAPVGLAQSTKMVKFDPDLCVAAGLATRVV